MIFRVLHHNNCFDGACSAAIFAKFHREQIGGADGYEFHGLSHGPPGELPETIFGAGENAIVDFKYARSPRLTWWFDHHQSAFLTPELRAHFEAGQADVLAGKAPARQFFDERAVSCTGFIARVARERFGFDTTGLEDLLYWADIVDGALYDSAEAVVAMREPAMQLTMVIENADTPEFIPRVIPLLTTKTLEQIAAEPFVAQKIAPQLAKHRALIELIEQRAQVQDGVVYLDLTDRVIEGLSKFILYFLFPDATYTVAVTRTSTRMKISVGTNPWTLHADAELANIAEICERFGGGGHARVGAISFKLDGQTAAVELSRKIAADLRRTSS